MKANFVISFIVSLTMIFSPLSGYGARGGVGNDDAAEVVDPVTGLTAAERAALAAAASTTTTNPRTSTTVPSMQNAAWQAATIQQKGKNNTIAFALVAAAAVAVTCYVTPPKPNCPMWIFGGLLAGAALGALTSTKGKSIRACEAVSTDACQPGFSFDPNNTGGSSTTNPTIGGSTTTTTMNVNDPAYKAIEAIDNELKKLADAGYVINKETGTIKTPDGKTFTSANFASAGAMKAAGFSDSQIGQVQKMKEDLQKALDADLKAKMSDSFAGGVSAAGGGGGAGKAGDVAFGNVANSGLMAEGEQGQKNADLVAGAAVLYNGELIGSANGNSLFDMNTRRIDFVEPTLLPP